MTIAWWGYALISAIAAAAVAILGKIGVQGISSNLGTAIRTVVIVVFAWAIVLARGEQRGMMKLPPKTLVFLVLSGVATGISWLAYFRALQLGPASRVAPIDKLSLPLAIILAAVVLNESMTWRLVLGVTLMTIGALITIK